MDSANTGKDPKDYLTSDNYTIKEKDLRAESSRVIPRQVQSGVTRGTQRIISTDGSYITLGGIPETNEFGIAFFDADGTMIFKLTGKTMYMYDSDSGDNTLQMGKLTNGTTNLIIVQPGTNVEDVIS